MAGALHRRPRFDLIGHVPKRRLGGPPLKHKALMLGMKPAAMFDAQHNHPINAEQMARKTGLKVAEAVTHVGGMLLLGKSLSGHDAFEVSKSLKPAHLEALARVRGAFRPVEGGLGGRGLNGYRGAQSKEQKYAAARLKAHESRKTAANPWGGGGAKWASREIVSRTGPLANAPVGMRGALKPTKVTPRPPETRARLNRAGLGPKVNPNGRRGNG